jgi:hypothetical protein
MNKLWYVELMHSARTIFLSLFYIRKDGRSFLCSVGSGSGTDSNLGDSEHLQISLKYLFFFFGLLSFALMQRVVTDDDSVMLIEFRLAIDDMEAGVCCSRIFFFFLFFFSLAFVFKKKLFLAPCSMLRVVVLLGIRAFSFIFCFSFFLFFLKKKNYFRLRSPESDFDQSLAPQRLCEDQCDALAAQVLQRHDVD